LDRIEFENSNAVERSERIHEAEKARGDKRGQQDEKRRRREKRKKKHEDPEAEEKRVREKIGKNLDIEA